MKTEDLKIQFLRFEDVKTALFCHCQIFYTQDVGSEDSVS